jgi:hypothetical protein
MTQTLPSALTTCSGIEVIPTEDGPLKLACTCDYCTGRRRTAKRIATSGDPFLGAAVVDEDEEW